MTLAHEFVLKRRRALSGPQSSLNALNALNVMSAQFNEAAVHVSRTSTGMHAYAAIAADELTLSRTVSQGNWFVAHRMPTGFGAAIECTVGPVYVDDGPQGTQTPPASPDRRAVRLRDLLAQLLGYTEPREGFTPPAPRAVMAMVALALLTNSAATTPVPYVLSDGEVGLKWKRNSRFVSAAIAPDGNLIGYATGPGWSVLEVDERLTEQPLNALLERIGSI